MNAAFPIWKIDTKFLIEDFIAKGFASVTCCISEKHLDKTWIGKTINENFIKELPATVDPCGENGEYHTFCYKGPIFKNEIKFSLGETMHKFYSPEENGFWFVDLIQHNEL